MSYIWIYICIAMCLGTIVVCCRNNIKKFCCCCCKRHAGDDSDSDDGHIRGHKHEKGTVKDDSDDWYGDGDADGNKKTE